MIDEIRRLRNAREYEKAWIEIQKIKNFFDPEPEPESETNLDLLFETSIVNFYLLSSQKLPMDIFFKRVLIPLLNSDNESYKKQTLKNLKYYLNSQTLNITNKYDFSKTFQAMARNKLDTFYHTNPCIFKFGDNYGLNIRCVNYSIMPNGVYKMLDDTLVTLNKFFILDKESFKPILDSESNPGKILNIQMPTPSQTTIQGNILGYEDMRIFHQSKSKSDSDSESESESEYLTTGSHLLDNKIRIITGAFLKDTENVLIEKIWDTAKPVEKNWVYLNKDYLIYQWYPNPVLIQRNTGQVIECTLEKPLPKFFQLLKGSTCAQFIEETNEYWIGVHFNNDTVPRVYYNMILVFEFSEQLTITSIRLKRYSLPFKFYEFGNIEFYLGMIVEPEKDRIVFSASQNDNSANVYVCDIHSIKFVDV